MISKMEGGVTNAMTYGSEHVHAPMTYNSYFDTYGKNGNMTYMSGPSSGSRYAFNAENRLGLQTVGLTQTTYQYDGAGELSRRVAHSILDQVNGQPTGTHDVKDTFVEGIYEAESTFCYSAVTSITKYYMAFGRVIASRTNGVLSYSLADHLGSTTQQISGGTPGTAIKYFPFGAPRNGTVSPERAYTGQQRENDQSGMGLYYYHARFYSTTTAHFVSADTSTADGLNRYAYVGGNPLTRVDPTGHCFTFGDGPAFSCSSQDANQWLDWALNDSTWVGDIARYGVLTSEFWSNARNNFQDNPRLPAALLTTFSSAVKREYSKWPLMSPIGWATIGAEWQVSGRFLAAATHDMLFGTQALYLLAVVHPDEIAGGYNIWGSTANFAYDGQLRDQLLAFRFDGGPQYRAASPADSLQSLTVFAAKELAVNGVELSGLAWSDDQLTFLTNEGYSPQRSDDWWSYFKKALDGLLDLRDIKTGF